MINNEVLIGLQKQTSIRERTHNERSIAKGSTSRNGVRSKPKT